MPEFLGVADDLGCEPIPGVADASGCPHPTRLLTPICPRKRGKIRQVDRGHQNRLFKFSTKYLCGIGVGSPFDADSQDGALGIRVGQPSGIGAINRTSF